MSRSKHNYYQLCSTTGRRSRVYSREIGEDGFCEFHRPDGRWHGAQRQCIPEREYYSRRGVVRRKERFPWWSWKLCCPNPPRDIKRVWRGRERAKYRDEMVKHPDDPCLFDGDRWLAGLYSRWS